MQFLLLLYFLSSGQLIFTFLWLQFRKRWQIRPNQTKCEVINHRSFFFFLNTMSMYLAVFTSLLQCACKGYHHSSKWRALEYLHRLVQQKQQCTFQSTVLLRQDTISYYLPLSSVGQLLSFRVCCVATVIVYTLSGLFCHKCFVEGISNRGQGQRLSH